MDPVHVNLPAFFVALVLAAALDYPPDYWPESVRLTRLILTNIPTFSSAVHVICTKKGGKGGRKGDVDRNFRIIILYTFAYCPTAAHNILSGQPVSDYRAFLIGPMALV